MKTALDVDELAGVFNLEKDKIDAKIIEIDADDNYICIRSPKQFLTYTRLYEMATQLKCRWFIL